MFKITLDNATISNRVKSVIGVPDAFLSDSTITSPDFKVQAETYINDQLSEIVDNYPEETKPEQLQSKINVSAIYYICSQLAISMPVRLPIRMENISTKTLLQTIDWFKFSEEMLGRCNSILDDILEDEGVESVLGNTFIALSDETTYPNASI